MPRRFVSAQELTYYRAHFLEARWEDGIVCLECGRLCQAMGNHVRRHGLTLDEYREQWGYNRGTALMAPALRAGLRAWAFARGLPALFPPEARLQRLRAGGPTNVPRRLKALLRQSAIVKARYAAGARPWNLKVEGDVLRALVADGLPLGEVAARTGLTRKQALARIRALGLTSPGIPPPAVKVPEAVLLALRREGRWSSAIAARTGITVAAVAARLRKLRQRGVAVPPPQHSAMFGQRASSQTVFRLAPWISFLTSK